MSRPRGFEHFRPNSLIVVHGAGTDWCNGVYAPLEEYKGKIRYGRIDPSSTEQRLSVIEYDREEINLCTPAPSPPYYVLCWDLYDAVWLIHGSSESTRQLLACCLRCLPLPPTLSSPLPSYNNTPSRRSKQPQADGFLTLLCHPWRRVLPLRALVASRQGNVHVLVQGRRR